MVKVDILKISQNRPTSSTLKIVFRARYPNINPIFERFRSIAFQRISFFRKWKSLKMSTPRAKLVKFRNFRGKSENSYRISLKSLILCENHSKSLQTFENFENSKHFVLMIPKNLKRVSILYLKHVCFITFPTRENYYFLDFRFQKYFFHGFWKSPPLNLWKCQVSSNFFSRGNFKINEKIIFGMKNVKNNNFRVLEIW